MEFTLGIYVYVDKNFKKFKHKEKNMAVPTMMSPKALSKATNFSETGIRRLIRENKIVYVMVGRCQLVNYELFLEYYVIQAARSVSTHNLGFYEYYGKKSAEGKHHFVVLSHVAKKLARVVFSMLKNNTEYELKTS